MNVGVDSGAGGGCGWERWVGVRLRKNDQDPRIPHMQNEGGLSSASGWKSLWGSHKPTGAPQRKVSPPMLKSDQTIRRSDITAVSNSGS